MYFEACRHMTNPDDLLIVGQTAVTDSVCVYPAEVIGSSNVQVKLDELDRIWKSCGQIAPDTPLFTSFPGSRVNAVFVVEAEYELLMDQCLITGNEFSCPDFSFGRIR